MLHCVLGSELQVYRHAVLCYDEQYSAMPSRAVLCRVVLYCAKPCCAVLILAVLCYAGLWCAARSRSQAAGLP